MIEVYGITTCGSVKKALSFLKSKTLAHKFYDLKTVQVTPKMLDEWLLKQPMSVIFNTKGTKFKTLGLSKEMRDDEKKVWLLKEQLLFKRPIISCDNGALLVGFDESAYEKAFT